jgi:hypothetical protein
LRRVLQWRDFGNPRPGPDPEPGTVATAAQLRATYRRSVNAEHVPGTRPPRFRLKDDATIAVILQDQQCYVNAWVLRQPSDFQDRVLHHEQGHYDLVALFCRDLFIDLVQLTSASLPNAQQVIREVQRIFSRYDALIAGVHDAYDDGSEHGRNPDEQRRWDGFIQTAFTQPRSPAMRAPDGTPCKVQLASVLGTGGITI